MQIAVGNGCATGKNSIGLGDETEATTYQVEDTEFKWYGICYLIFLWYGGLFELSFRIGVLFFFSPVIYIAIYFFRCFLSAMVDLDMHEDDMEEEEFYEAIKSGTMAIQAVIHVVNEFIRFQGQRRIERPLTRRPVTTDGYIYINKILDEDPKIFRHVYRMFPEVFRKLCSIIREKTLLRDTRYICIEEMLAIFLLTIGQNNRYSQAIMTFSRSHFCCSKSFNKVLKALNTLAPELMAKPLTVQAKIRESTRFYPYFKVSNASFFFFTK